MPLDQQRQDRLKRHAVKRIVRVVVHSAENLAIQQASIHRHRRIDIDRPQVNSTCEASDIVESCLTQNFSDFQNFAFPDDSERRWQTIHVLAANRYVEKATASGHESNL